MNRKLFLRIAMGTGGFLGVAAVLLLATVQLRWDRVFDASPPALVASDDAELIARGEYLVFGPAHCADCHTPMAQWPRLMEGERLPLVGGNPFELPLGTWVSPNLTPDEETGIGRYSDAQLVRMLRHNIRPDGRVGFPVMEFAGLSDEDIVAVISYLRAQPAVRNEVPERRVGLLGRAIFAFAMKPYPDMSPPATSPPEGATLERGSYLANNVANCAGCHTERNLMDGSYIKPRFSGGMEMDHDVEPNLVFVTPNLTPHAGTGHITNWTEEQFLARFRVGEGPAHSHMPWRAFSMMNDDDLRAIYRYLMLLDPVENATGPALRPRN
jgi:mono/diheme cytochrome c family protein